jgi:hypothetical protein
MSDTPRKPDAPDPAPAGSVAVIFELEPLLTLAVHR